MTKAFGAPFPPFPWESFWLALEHPCGCLVDWGCDVRRKHELPHHLASVAVDACPWHSAGSFEGVIVDERGARTATASAAPASNECRMLPSGFFFRLAGEGQRANGQRNRRTALAMAISAKTQPKTA